jgi:phosphatidylserine/phosphatidylglycerophosphate/cardiolipin synthase-like enzyme
MNLSENSLDNNREIGIVIEDPDVIEDFSRQFLRDWDNGVSHIDWNFDT